MATYIKGKKEILYIWDGTSAYEPIVCLTSNSLNESVDEISAPSTKCDTGNALQRSAGQYSYEISFEGVYAETECGKTSWAELRTKLRSLGDFTWKIETTYANDSTDAEYGTAFFNSLEKTSETEDYITFSGGLLGTGSITSTDPHA